MLPARLRGVCAARAGSVSWVLCLVVVAARARVLLPRSSVVHCCWAGMRWEGARALVAVVVFAAVMAVHPGAAQTRVLTWPERCPQIGQENSNIISLVHTHSYPYSRHANMASCLHGVEPEKCGGFAALEADRRTIWVWGPIGQGCTKKTSPETVAKIATTDSAFAVLTVSGKVAMAWGNPGHGGTLPNPAPSNVLEIYANPFAFVVLKKDGGVEAWGDPKFGGYLPPARFHAMNDTEFNVHTIIPSTFAFAALRSINGSRNNNTVVPWGEPEYGGDPILQDCNPHELYQTVILCTNSTVQGLDLGVERVVSNGYAFLAFKAHGEIVTFGFREYGGNCDQKLTWRTNNPDDQVVRVVSSFANFVGITRGGRAVNCGYEDWGWLNNADQKVQSGVVDVVSTDGAFAALMQDKTVVTWGKELGGGDSRSVRGRLKNVKSVVGNMLAFTALREDGTVVTWGNPLSGGNVETPVQRCYVRYRRSMNGNVLVHIWVRLMLISVEKVYAGSEAFVAVRKDQGLIAWGDQQYGADLCMSYFTERNQPEAEFKDWEKVIDIKASFNGFAALVRTDTALKTVIMEERAKALAEAMKKPPPPPATKGQRSGALSRRPKHKHPIVSVVVGVLGGLAVGAVALG